MDDLYRDRLVAIEDALADATPGPWCVEYDSCDCSDGVCSHGSFVYGVILPVPWVTANNPDGEYFETLTDYHFRYSEFDELPIPTAEFMVNSRGNVEWLVEEVKRLRDALQLIDRSGCDKYTGMRCLDSDSGHVRGAKYGADAWCDACVAAYALLGDQS